jgi:group I intron endonuclease
MILNLENIKNLPKKSGIYKITSPTDKIYIGESYNLNSRCRRYLNPNKIKGQKAIYNSILKYGHESHKIEILELCDENILLERERFYQEHFNSVENGLNCFYTGTKDKKKKYSESTKKIMSEKSKGENNPFFGKKHSDESLKKISEASKGENNPNYGGKFKTDDWLLKQSISNSKKPLKIIDTITNEEFIFINSKEAGLFLNVSGGKIRQYKNKYKLKKRYIIEDA